MQIKKYVGKKPTVAQIKNLITEIVGEGLPKRNIVPTDWSTCENYEDGKLVVVVMEIRFTDSSNGWKFRISTDPDMNYRLSRIY